MTVTTENEQLLNLLKSFSNSQSTRVALYKEFDDAFADYKAKRLPIDQYQSICGIVTDGFQEVSQQIQSVEHQLRDTYSREDLAQLIRRVQEGEREKLKLTVNIQIWEIESETGDKDFSEAITEARPKLAELLDSINDILEEVREAMSELSYE
ncbi:DNA repair REX1-B-domain-containing protein [Umbelopsis sp. PMI_123]|nr:DNA repair REX1-B-domain-containing protein [Umbelopsis sp. PMI_123]